MKAGFLFFELRPLNYIYLSLGLPCFLLFARVMRTISGNSRKGKKRVRRVKYTPAGGKISIAIEAGRQRTGFFVENDSPPLSEEALSKVWDTFYRADEARSGGGTGLGLAIARSSIELHGGKCAVRNTKTGVQFSFSL